MSGREEVVHLVAILGPNHVPTVPFVAIFPDECLTYGTVLEHFFEHVAEVTKCLAFEQAQRQVGILVGCREGEIEFVFTRIFRRGESAVNSKSPCRKGIEVVEQRIAMRIGAVFGTCEKNTSLHDVVSFLV